MIQKVSVKARKIKTILFNSNNLQTLGKSACFRKRQTSSQSQFSCRVHLKSLSQERNRKKIVKMIDSFETESIRSQMVENINNLQSQYVNLQKNVKSCRQLRSSINRTIPHTKINLVSLTDKKQLKKHQQITQRKNISNSNKLQISKLKNTKRKGIKLCTIKVSRLELR